MATYRKKPVEVAAIRCREAVRYAMTDKWQGIPEWLESAYDAGEILFISPTEGVSIRTLEGPMEAKPDDWIICGVKGELYPCKPDIFAMTYEAVA